MICDCVTCVAFAWNRNGILYVVVVRDSLVCITHCSLSGMTIGPLFFEVFPPEIFPVVKKTTFPFIIYQTLLIQQRPFNRECPELHNKSWEEVYSLLVLSSFFQKKFDIYFVPLQRFFGFFFFPKKNKFKNFFNLKKNTVTIFTLSPLRDEKKKRKVYQNVQGGAYLQFGSPMVWYVLCFFTATVGVYYNDCKYVAKQLGMTQQIAHLSHKEEQNFHVLYKMRYKPFVLISRFTTFGKTVATYVVY